MFATRNNAVSAVQFIRQNEALQQTPFPIQVDVERSEVGSGQAQAEKRILLAY